MRRHKKKTAKTAMKLWLLAALTCVFLQGCGKKTQEPDERPDQSGQSDLDTAETQADSTRSDYLMFAYTNHFWFEAIWPILEQAYGDRAEFKEYTPDELYGKLQEAASAAPGGVNDFDIIMADASWICEFASKGTLLPLDPLLSGSAVDPAYDINDIVPAYLDLCKYNGQLYALPLGASTNTLAIRQDLFELYGMQPPATMDEMYDAAVYFSEQGLYGAVSRRAAGSDIVYAWLQFLYPFGGQVLDGSGQSAVNSPEAVRALEFFCKLVKDAKPAGFPEENETDFDAALNSFRLGRAAMYLDAAVPGAIENLDLSTVLEKCAYLPFPSEQRQASALSGWMMAIPSNAKYTDLAFEIIQAVSSKANEEQIVLAGRDPIRVSGFQNPALIEQLPYLPFLEKNLETAVSGFQPRVPEWRQIEEALSQSLTTALEGAKDPQTALDEAHQAIIAILP
ncbi:MAG: extracellular solute-binding protein [Clostridiales bacterium]|nr:extracellular solute-binding protein [Clostridiales bacterium]